MSNSGTVDRYLGQVKLQSLRPGHIAPGGLECALCVIVQDSGGRVRKKLDPTEPPLGKGSQYDGGAVVAQPSCIVRNCTLCGMETDASQGDEWSPTACNQRTWQSRVL